MSRIKSAWEIALEKTKDIVLDEARYRAETLEKEGMALAGGFLNDNEQKIENLQARLASYSGEDYKTVRKGIIKTIFANLNLPSDSSYRLRFDRTCALCALADESGQASQVVAGIGDFFEQFLQAREEFSKRMEAQLRQAMQENPEQVNTAQYAKLIEQNVKRMEDQYSGALENTKETLRQVFGE
ncbi:MAG: hypothetical protein K5634_02245 [Sphaerochaetaceae bacterium]|nr:hypothetical protein [Sphaerochaetaceae bacterium]